jgi:RNA polymerase sigma factor (sigma-70 family)
MPTQISEVVQRLRRATLRQDEAGLTDGQLLGRFIEQRDEAAVAALVRRHGPMVWGVCRRILRAHHDAEDAFQATFLVLIRKAGSVRKREIVGNWLYGVAHQTALRARATAAKQFARERQVVDMPEPAVKEPEVSGGLQAVLDQELSRLPEKYRVGIVLCDLEGKTRKVVARQLGLPEGTLAGRLTRGRAMLAKRLARHGLAVSGGTLAAVLSQQAASACVPTSVVSSTIKAVALVAAGQAAAGMISAKAIALTEGVLKAMLMSKLKAVMTVLFVALGMVVFGGELYLHQAEAQQGPTAKSPVASQTDEKKGDAAQQQDQEQVKEGFTAWGKEVGGLQAGLGFHPGKKRAYSHNETVTLVVRVRNVSKEMVSLQYLKKLFVEEPPTVTDADGRPLSLSSFPIPQDNRKLDELDLAPGKEIEIDTMQLQLRSVNFVDQFSPLGLDPTIRGTGKFRVRYERLAPKDIDNIGAKLATGELELEVKDAEKLPEQEKEGFTAWGKEVGGLQAGLGFRPYEKRAYSHGETVKLVVRVRNVGKEDFKFSYLHPFFENQLTVTDGDGKPVPQQSVNDEIGERTPGELTLAPGKEIDLHELKRELRPASESGNKRFESLHGTGKVSVQYERVLGMPSMGVPGWKLDPTLSKLATGQLELEIKSTGATGVK